MAVSWPLSLPRNYRPAPSPLHQAVLDDDVAEVQKLLANGTSADESGFQHERPLHLARSREMVDLLVKAGGSVNVVTDYGDTPLHYACARGFESAIQAMLDHGANVNAANAPGEPPLVWAMRSDWDGDDPFSQLLPSRPVHKDTLALVELLIGRGTNVNSRGTGGLTPLMEGTISMWFHRDPQQLDVARRLLDAGADVNAVTSDGDTALHEAVRTEPALVQLLLDSGAKVNVAEWQGRTPLMVAVDGQADAQTIRLLLDHGARLDLRDRQGRRAIDMTTTPEIARILADHAGPASTSVPAGP
ncbi:MAG: ankyrin repeat domain-containing protein [Phycisphaeraceae bacterium]